MNELFQKINDSTERAKSRYNEQLSRFHVGDIVYPLYQKWLPVIWGTVVEIVPQIHKINVNINGIVRQFEPEDLIPTNPELKPGSSYNEERDKIVEGAEKKIKASFDAFQGENQFEDFFCEIKFVDGDKEIEIPVKVSANSEEIAEGLLNGFACNFMKEHFEDADFSLGEIVQFNNSFISEDQEYFCIDPFGEVSKITSGKITASTSIPLNPEFANVKTYMTAYSKIYSHIDHLAQGVKSDIDWSSIYEIVDEIRSLGLDVSASGVNDSNYRSNGGSKTWNYNVSFMNIDGEKIVTDIYLTAQSAGDMQDPWSQYTINVGTSGGEVVSKQIAEEKVKIIPQYKLWKQGVIGLSNLISNSTEESSKQYSDFIYDTVNKTVMADADCQKLDMESFKEDLIDAIYAFKTAYEFGRQQLSSPDENQKLEEVNNLCNALSLAMGIKI